ncbi:MAG: cobalt-precorrin-5B (C(1))-methyltransferase CbiD [Oscillospiraceae bacterium]|jgi:cobalamin biosynthesis protein CbiD
MAFEHYIHTGGRRLRCGYTTGTCAALAAAGAVCLLLTGTAPETVQLTTPKGLTVQVPLQACQLKDGVARCAVQKDGGDDVDSTAGLLIVAEVSRTEQPGVQIDGGKGVGRVTKPGLDQPVGAAAINRVPREMIRQQVETICEHLEYAGGIAVCIQVPDGERAAKKTFNPALGVQGGISILGTSGIVEPMSVQALIDTIALELRQTAAQGKRDLILTPGNYGREFLQSQGWYLSDIPIVTCSNFIGDALDQAAVQGFERVLLVGHIGKLVKLAGGIMNTHSRWGDCRTELLCAHAAICGADTALCRELMDAATTDACISLLEEANLRAPVLDSLLKAIDRQLQRRVDGAYQIGAVLFSNRYGLLGQTKAAQEMIEICNRKQAFFTE